MRQHDRYQQLLDALQAYGRDDRVRTALAGRYGSARAGRALLDEHARRIAAALGPVDAPLKDVTAEAQDRLIRVLLADDVLLPAATLRGSRSRKGINARQCLCLWLASRHQQSASLSGLWRLWEDVLPAARPLPATIRRVLDPPAREGGEQAYLAAALITLSAASVCAARHTPLRLRIPMPEAHRRLAKLLLAPSSANADAEDRALWEQVACLFGVSVATSFRQQAGDVLDASRREASSRGLDPNHAGTMLTWIVGTCVERRDTSLADPAWVFANEMPDRTKRNHVHVDLLRGGNTLRDRVVRRLLRAAAESG